MTEEGGTREPAPAGPVNRKAGWYRDRKTGQRRFWNGVVWTDLSDVITPYAVEPTGPPERAASTALAGRDLSRRAKIIGLSVTVVVLVVAILLVISLVNSDTGPVSSNDTAVSPSFSSDTEFPTLPSVTATSPFQSTTTSSSTSSTTVSGSPLTTSPVGTSPAVTAPPVTTELPNPAKNVAIIGDSITKLAEHNLEHALHGYNLVMDAVGGTTMADHLQKIKSIESDGQPRDWVIELGSNDALPEQANPNWAKDFANEVAALQTQRCVVFVTVNPQFGTIASGINRAIAGAVATHANFHSFDWGNIEYRKPQWLWSDHIHPSKSGVVELTKLDRKAIRDSSGSLTRRRASPSISVVVEDLRPDLGRGLVESTMSAWVVKAEKLRARVMR